jgi:4'-phosphopantetheinyl transferase
MTNELGGVLATPLGFARWLALHQDGIPAADASPPNWLQADEVVTWQALKTDKRRGDWLLGRWTAKQLVAELVAERTGQQLSPDQIAILPHADGWPMVALPTFDGMPVITLSISHSRPWGFCAAVEGENRPLGADIERNEPRSPGFVEEYFTPLEWEYLTAAPPEQLVALTNAIWSGKEAALKAIRRGLAEDTRIVSCLPHPRMGTLTEWLPSRMAWNLDWIERPLPGLTGYWRLNDGYVMTLAVAAEVF